MKSGKAHRRAAQQGMRREAHWYSQMVDQFSDLTDDELRAAVHYSEQEARRARTEIHRVVALQDAELFRQLLAIREREGK